MKKTLLCLLCVLLLAGQLIPAASAVSPSPAPGPTLPESAQFAYLDSARDIVIWVSWPTEEPEVIFVAPDGTRFDPAATAENTVTVVGQNEFYYVIYNAPAGQWSVEYDKKGNESIEVSMHNYNPGLTISHFETGPVEDGRISVSFAVNGEEQRRYDYRISAVIDRAGGEKELYTGSSVTGQEINIGFSLSSLASYSSYMLKLHVWYTEDETDYFDIAFSEPFSYTNTTLTNPMTDFGAVIEPETQMLYVSWPEADWRVERIMVALFEDDGEEPVFFDEYVPSEYSEVQLSYDPAATKLALEVSVMVDGIYVTGLRKEIVPAEFGLTLPEGDAFASTSLPMSYSGFSGELVDVQVNEGRNTLNLRGDGSVTLQLKDDWNTVLVSYTDGQNVTWRINRRVFVDRVAPILHMGENYDGMHTSQRLIDIIGTVQDYATVTINGAPVEIGADGAFSQSVALAGGENDILVIAADALGNEAQYQATIICTADGYEPPEDSVGPMPEDGSGGEGGDLLSRMLSGKNYIALAVAGVLCLLVVLYALLFWRRRKGEDR